MRIILKTIVLLSICCYTLSAADTEQSLSAGISAGVAGFQATSVYQTRSSASLDLSYQFHPRALIKGSAARLTADQSIESPAGNETITSRFHVFSFQLMGNFFSLPLLGDLSVGGGTGFVQIKQNAFDIDLGALGTSRIPSQQDQHFLYSLSSTLSRPIGPRFAAVLSAQMHFLALEEQQNMYTISGGVNVRLW